VRKSHLLAVLAAGILSSGLIAAYGIAQQPITSAVRPPSRGATIAMLDVKYIFKKHAGFKAWMNGMNADVERAEADVKAAREEMRKLAEQLQQYQKGSQQYKQLEAQMAEKQADVTVRVQLQKKGFMEQQAKIYHAVYQDIFQAVRSYAQANGISAVVQFDGERSDPNNPETVVRDINKPVIYYAEQLDITPVILAQLNQRPLNTNPTPSPVPTVRGPQSVPFR